MDEYSAPGQTPSPPLPPMPPQERLPLLRRLHPAIFALLALGLVFFLYQIVGGGITLLLSRGNVTDMDVNHNLPGTGALSGRR